MTPYVQAERDKWYRAQVGRALSTVSRQPWSSGANYFPLIPDLDGCVRESWLPAFDYAVKHGREPVVIAVPGIDPFLKKPPVVDLGEARFPLKMRFVLPWYGIGYQGPTLTHALTLLNGKGFALSGFAVTLMGSLLGGLKVSGKSTSRGEVKELFVRIGNGARDCVGVQVGDDDADDVSNVLFSGRVEGAFEGSDVRSKIRSACSLGSVGVQFTGGNTLGHVVQEASLSGLRVAVSTAPNRAWGLTKAGGATSVLRDVGGSHVGRFIDLNAGFELTHDGGRIENSAVYATIGLPDDPGDAFSYFAAREVSAHGMAPDENALNGLGRFPSAAQVMTPGDFKLGLSLKFDGPAPQTPITAGVAKSGENESFAIGWGGNLSPSDVRVIPGSVPLEGFSNVGEVADPRKAQI